jgi:hypothetical protein
MYGKYGYDIRQASDYVLHHLSIGRPLHYHNVPHHLYWQRPPAELEPTDPIPFASGGEPGRFVRADNGWAAGLHPYDRFVKNTHEILSPVNELTARLQMTHHEFLTPDRRARRTVFGEGRDAVEVVINPGDQDLRRPTRWGGDVVLPPDGFVVEGRILAAFCATRWNGLDYAQPVLFVIRSQDGRPLNRSRAVRVFHGFGDARLRLGDRQFEVVREQVVDPGAR